MKTLIVTSVRELMEHADILKNFSWLTEIKFAGGSPEGRGSVFIAGVGKKIMVDVVESDIVNEGNTVLDKKTMEQPQLGMFIEAMVDSAKMIENGASVDEAALAATVKVAASMLTAKLDAMKKASAEGGVGLPEELAKLLPEGTNVKVSRINLKEAPPEVLHVLKLMGMIPNDFDPSEEGEGETKAATLH